MKGENKVVTLNVYSLINMSRLNNFSQVARVIWRNVGMILGTDLTLIIRDSITHGVTLSCLMVNVYLLLFGCSYLGHLERTDTTKLPLRIRF